MTDYFCLEVWLCLSRLWISVSVVLDPNLFRVILNKGFIMYKFTYSVRDVYGTDYAMWKILVCI